MSIEKSIRLFLAEAHRVVYRRRSRFEGLRAHAQRESKGGKDFWTEAVVLTSKDASLTKAHARYLEARLIGLAQEANRARLLIGTTPPLVAWPEADLSNMECFSPRLASCCPC